MAGIVLARFEVMCILKTEHLRHMLCKIFSLLLTMLNTIGSMCIIYFILCMEYFENE